MLRLLAPHWHSSRTYKCVSVCVCVSEGEKWSVCVCMGERCEESEYGKGEFHALYNLSLAFILHKSQSADLPSSPFAFYMYVTPPLPPHTLLSFPQVPFTSNPFVPLL